MGTWLGFRALAEGQAPHSMESKGLSMQTAGRLPSPPQYLPRLHLGLHSRAAFSD